MNPKDGTAGTIVEPEAPVEATEAGNSQAGQVEQASASPVERATGAKKEQKVPALQPPESDEEAKKRTSWIEIELLDEAGKPVPGERYEITTPDNKLASGRLDDKGFARVEQIEPGTCKISFPDLDKEAWELQSGGGGSSAMQKPTGVDATEQEQAESKTITITESESAEGEQSSGAPPQQQAAPEPFEITGKEKTTENAVKVLEELLEAAGLHKATITSGSRTAYDQARIMYDNIVKHGVDHQKNLYGSNGDKVIEVYVANKAQARDEVIDLMEAKILEIGPSKVSNHCSNDLDVIDVAPSSIEDKPAFEKAIKASSKLKKYILPPTDPAYHLEIPK